MQLAMREYDDDDIGELDYDDPQTRGHAPISRFDNVISDFLINTSVSHDKYQILCTLLANREQQYHMCRFWWSQNWFIHRFECKNSLM